jgi:hypothetical protein
MEICEICGNYYSEELESGLFTLYSAKNKIVMHEHMCGSCGENIRHYILGMIDANSEM